MVLSSCPQRFKSLLKKYKFNQVISSLNFPQANGEADITVKRAKKILNQKHLVLQIYCDTKHSLTKISPTQALINPQLEMRLPILPVNLLPGDPDNGAFSQSDVQAKQSYKFHYDRHHGARNLPLLPLGQPAFIKLDSEKKLEQVRYRHPV